MATLIFYFMGAFHHPETVYARQIFFALQPTDIRGYYILAGSNPAMISVYGCVLLICFTHLDQDVSAVLPYLNATLLVPVKKQFVTSNKGQRSG